MISTIDTRTAAEIAYDDVFSLEPLELTGRLERRGRWKMEDGSIHLPSSVFRPKKGERFYDSMHLVR